MIYASYRAGASFITIEFANTAKTKRGFQLANSVHHVENAIKKHYDEFSTYMENIGKDFTVRLLVKDRNHNAYLNCLLQMFVLYTKALMSGGYQINVIEL